MGLNECIQSRFDRSQYLSSPINPWKRQSRRTYSPSTAAARRALWASFGVICERAFLDVLSLGLEPVSKKRLLTSTGDEGGWTAQAVTPRHIATEKMSFTAAPYSCARTRLSSLKPRDDRGTRIASC